MLNRLKIENFKAWRKADLKFGKVTGFFGANSAGKSSLLQLLLMLKQTKNATDRGLVIDFGGPEHMVNLGTFRDVVNENDTRKRMSWILDWTLPETLKINDQTNPSDDDPTNPSDEPLFESDRLETRCKVGWNKDQGSLRPHELAYRFDGVDFRLQPKKSSKKGSFELATDSPDFQFIRKRTSLLSLPPPVKTYLFPDQVQRYYENAYFLGDFELAYEKLMDSIYYLGPLREYPRREYHWGGSRPDDVGLRGERTVDAILAATSRQGTKNLGHQTSQTSFQETIADWLKRLGLIHDFSLKEIRKGTNLYQAKVKNTPSSEQTALTDVGFGVSQILPALVLLYYVPEGSTVLMEQPEIHLHPAVQSGLADVMLDVAEDRNVQVVVESHSEHLVRRLQRRVAEEKASYDDVKLYFISANRGAAQASDLVLNEWGEIENWPDKFFGDDVGEIVAITQNALRRRMELSE